MSNCQPTPVKLSKGRSWRAAPWAKRVPGPMLGSICLKTREGMLYWEKGRCEGQQACEVCAPNGVKPLEGPYGVCVCVCNGGRFWTMI